MLSQIAPSLKAVAQHFGRSRRAAQRRARDGMPRLAGGKFDLEQVEAWLRGKKYLGSSLREMEAETQINALMVPAISQIRQGLHSFCKAFIAARRKNRKRLMDQVVRDLLDSTMRQADLVPEASEGPLHSCSGRPGDLVAEGGKMADK